jgi:transcriptional regulator with XRE-family HTH domain
MLEDIGKRIKAAREKRDMTMKQVAEAIGVTEATFSRYESGHIEKIPLSRIEAISNVLGVDPAEIMGWKRKDPPAQVTLAAHRTDGYDTDLPEEAQEELEHLLDYLKSKYKKKG